MLWRDIDPFNHPDLRRLGKPVTQLRLERLKMIARKVLIERGAIDVNLIQVQSLDPSVGPLLAE
jgi:hypothetical protein